MELSFNSYTKNDLAIFYANNSDEYLRTKITEIHKLYDELQGNCNSNLTGDDINKRSETYRSVVSFAFVVKSLTDAELDAFLLSGQKVSDLIKQNPANDSLSEKAKQIKHRSPFYSMLKLEKRLRLSENGLIDLTEKKRLDSSICVHLSSSTHSTKPSKQTFRIGTSILYPIMAIVHDELTTARREEWAELITLVDNFRKENLGVDFTAIHKNIEMEEAKSTKQLKPVLDVITPEKEKRENVGLDVPQSTPKREHAKIVISEEIINQMAQDKQFVTNQDFILYAKQEFLSQEEYDYASLGKYIVYITDKIVQGSGDSSRVATGNKSTASSLKETDLSEQQDDENHLDYFEFRPFKNAETPQEVRNKFEQLPKEIQDSFVSNFSDTKQIIKNLLSDVSNYEKIPIQKQIILAKMRKNNKYVKEFFIQKEKQDIRERKIEKQEKIDEKMKKKAIRRMFTLARKEQEENLLKNKIKTEKEMAK